MPTEVSPSRRYLRTDLLATGGRLVERLLRSRIPQMAAALSYRTIFSLIPMLVVGLVILKAFTSEEDMARLLEESLDYTGLSRIAVSEEAHAPPPGADDVPEPGGVDGEAAPDAPRGAGEGTPPHAGAPPAPTAADEWIQDRVEQIAQIRLGAVGVFGVLLLIYAALSMLVEVERAFNQLTHASTGRAWHKRVMQYWTVLTLGTLLLLATFYVGRRFSGVIDALADTGGWFVAAAGGFFATVAISTLLLLFMYVTMPNTRVQVRPALCGAILGAILWEAGKWGFTRYLDYSTNYARLYGSLALIPLFLLWVYLTWIIVLFGLHVAWAIQTRRSWLHAPIHDDEPMIADPACVLSISGEVSRRFHSGAAPVTPREIAEALSLPAPVAETMLRALERGGFLRRVEAEDDDAKYVLARAPEAIAAPDLLRVGLALAGAAGAALVPDLDDARMEALRGRTLADISRGGDASAPPPPSNRLEDEPSAPLRYEGG